MLSSKSQLVRPQKPSNLCSRLCILHNKWLASATHTAEAKTQLRSLPKMWRMNTNTMKLMADTITACCSWERRKGCQGE